MTIAAVALGPLVLIAAVICTAALSALIHPRPARSNTMEQFTEYAVRVTLPGFQPRITPCATFVRDAHRAYDHAVSLHGKDAVEFLTREVTQSDWLASTLPPPPDAPPDPDGGLCDPMPRVRTLTDVHLPAPALPAAGESVANSLETT